MFNTRSIPGRILPTSDSSTWPSNTSSGKALTRTEAFARMLQVTGLDAQQATTMLWNTYDPQYHVWLPFAGIGVAAIIAQVFFARAARKWADMDA